MQNQFVLNSQALECFVKNMPQPAYINSVDTGEYIYGNQSGLCFLNTADYLNNLSQDPTSKKISLESIANHDFLMNQKLLQTGETVTENNCLALSKEGKLCLQTIIKMPVIDCKERISAILTLRLSAEKAINPIELYQLYKSMNKNRREAINKTMDHLRIGDYFQELLTEKELICLLHMRIDTSHKSLMNKLFVSKKTIETHVSHLLRKSNHHNLTAVITFLRSEY